MALVISAFVTTPSPALAADYPTGCTSTWSSWRQTGSPAWGQWRYCSAPNGDHMLYRFQVDDMLTDGYAVHIEAQMILSSWQHIPWSADPGCLQSTGNGETSSWPGWGLGPSEQVTIRLVKGTCWPHGNYGTSGNWLIVNV
jgi:hypothetical protein